MNFPRRAACAFLLTSAALVVVPSAIAQVSHPKGQNIAPVYEGWEKNSDGSFNLVFGYFNRNHDEVIDLPVGPDNSLDPGGPDQGQPTHFFPRRNRFLFRVRVPKDFGNKEVVWTLTSHGVTEKAYATLKSDYFIDDIVIQNNNGAGGGGGGNAETIGNKAPVLEVSAPKTQTAKAGQPITLTAFAFDDGKPKARRLARQSQGNRGTPDTATGLRLSWFVYRGQGNVTFDPPQFEVWEDYREGTNSPWAAGWMTPTPPSDGKWLVRVTFDEPGTYVVRCLAHDGGLMDSEDLTVVVSR